MLPVYVGVVGSRRRNRPEDLDIIYNILKSVGARYPSTPVVVVSGGAVGVDSFAKQAAGLLGYDFIEIPIPMNPRPTSRWEFTLRAHFRNRKIAKICDELFALVNADRRGGTENTLLHCDELGTPYTLIDDDGKAIPIKTRDDDAKAV